MVHQPLEHSGDSLHPLHTGIQVWQLQVGDTLQHIHFIIPLLI
jgi:hypothetical protein